MGMDYEYAGSASYPRFSRELTCVASLFGIEKKTKELVDGTIDYWMGRDFDNEDRYVFPDGTSPVIQKFFDEPFEELTVEETVEVRNFLATKREEVEKISPQLMYELDQLVNFNEHWSIF